MSFSSFSRSVPTVLHSRQFPDSTILSHVGRVEAALAQALSSCSVKRVAGPVPLEQNYERGKSEQGLVMDAPLLL
jgi:hypothetical protein